MDSIEPDRLIGSLAAIGCGIGFRYLGQVIGFAGVAGVAVVVGACYLALIDALSG